MITAFLSESHLVSGSIAEQREAMAAAVGSVPPPEGIALEPVALGGRRGERLVPPAAREDATVLYLHGGGYCTGSLDSHRGLAGRIALAAGCPVVTLDYRLAPEHPHPAALDDALAAYHDLLAGGSRPDRIAIAGDSAGGGLTVATLVALRDGGSPLPAAAVCLSPWVDLTQTAGSYDRVGPRDPMITKSGLDLFARSYLAGTAASSALASPLFADLSGLPPVLVEVGEREALVDDATRLADRLRAAGVSVSLTIWPELIHVFQAFPGSVVPEADQSIDAVGSFLSHHLSGLDLSEPAEGDDHNDD
ncbi:MAG TPA: alpha/beta hydrolase [Acidimicrobiales bacterium]|jgi:acetyl esterase/lipase|nr:alpha/beta hydrolase [Acidimicrobiales bacterium]